MEHVHSTPMAGTTVLVTGATSGIGKATALGLATMGAHLAITGRNPQRTESAAREIRAAGGEQVDVFVADLSSQAEVRRLATEILEQLPRINVLVNNVGGYWDSRHVTADGLEHTFALNHLAPFLLTNLLLERLKQSAPARVVRWRPTHRPWGEWISTTCKGNGPTPVHVRTTNQSSPMSCSPTSWLDGCGARLSPPTRCILVWCAPPSEPRTRPDSSACSSHSCGRS